MPVAALRDHQHELIDVTERQGFVFGTEDTGYLTLTRPLIVAGDIRESDQPRPQEDGESFGRDFRGGKTIQFEVGVLTDTVSGFEDPARANRDYMNALEALWTDERWRDDPQAFAILRTCEAGQVHRAYGRPRAYGEVVGKLTDDGYTPVAMQFSLMEDVWYADAPSTFSLSTPVPGDVTGVSAPLSAPVSSLDTSSLGIGEIVVGGTRPTWVVVEFDGPCTNPSVILTWVAPTDVLRYQRQAAPIRVSLIGGIAGGAFVVFDPQPWRRTVIDSDQRSRAGDMTGNTTSMKFCRLWPGRYNVAFTANDPTGTARVNLSWLEADSRP